MKKSVFLTTCTLAAFLMMACGSTPAPEAEPEVPAVVEEVKEEIKEEVAEAIPEPDFAEANNVLLAKTDAAREAAILAEAKKYYPEMFNEAETSYNVLKNDIQNNPKVDYSAQINDLTARYNSLAVASQAQKLKEKADALSLKDEAQTEYDAGAKALEEYANAATTANGEELLAKAQVALNSYSDVVGKGLRANAARERKASLEAKKLADSVKAAIAKKDEYTKAAETFKKADASYVTLDIEGALKGYKASKETFNSLYENIAAKRAAAQALIDAAKQKVSNSENYAEEADSLAPLAEEVAGIEKEDTVLLEEDKLENPEEAIINVEEGLTAKAAEKVAETAIAAEETVTNTAEQTTDEVKNTIENAVESVTTDLSEAK